MTTLNEQELKELNKMDALEVNPNKMPAYMASTDSNSHFINLMRKLIVANMEDKKESQDVKRITEQELHKVLKELHHQREDNIPKWFLRGPTTFGNESLTDGDRKHLKYIRDNAKDALSLEALIKIILEFHHSSNSKYTEAQLMSALQFLLPTRMTTLASSLRNSLNMNFDLFITELQTSFGTSKSLNQSIDEVNRMINNAKDVAELLEDLDLLLDQTLQDKEVLGDIMLASMRQYLKRKIGTPMTNSIILAHSLQPRKDFKTFKNLCLNTYLGDINDEIALHGNKKMHEVNEPKPEEIKMDLVLKGIHELITEIHNMRVSQSMHNTNANNVECFHCKGNHFVRECPNKPRMQPKFSNKTRSFNSKNTGNGLTYCRAKCSVHPSANHKNEECKQQRGPCGYRPNHSAHCAGDCRRPVRQGQNMSNRSSGSQQSRQNGYNRQQPQGFMRQGNPQSYGQQGQNGGQMGQFNQQGNIPQITPGNKNYGQINEIVARLNSLLQ